MMSEIPEGVSVVVPTYNRPDYLNRLLKSIEKQTRPVDEIIIVNDCSSNIGEYYDIIGQFTPNLNITHIVNDANQGAPVCRNIGIKASHYKYIALTDDDDEWEVEKNAKEYELISTGRLGLVYSHGVCVDESGNILYKFEGMGRGHDLKAILRKCFIPSSSVMVTHEAICEAGMFDPRMPSCQDWDMWVRIIKNGYAYGVVEEKLIIYHKHSGESIGASPKARIGYRLFYRKHIKQYISMFLFSKEYKICLRAIGKTIF